MASNTTSTRAQREAQQVEGAGEFAESVNKMKKRPRSVSVDMESYSEPEDSESDEDYAPDAKKRKKTGGRVAKAAPKKRGRPPKTRATAAPAISTASRSTASRPAAGKSGANTTITDTRDSSTPDAATPDADTPAASSPAANTSSGAGKNKIPELSTAIHVNARLPACDLGAVEMLTFFPYHFQWPEVCLRLYRNKWTSLAIAKAIMHARNKIDPHTTRYHKDFPGIKDSVETRRAGLRHQVLSAGREFFDDKQFKSSSSRMTPVTTYNASTYTPRKPRPGQQNHLWDARLIDIAQGVVYWPVGEDCGIVTQAIAYAVQNRNHDLTTADIPNMAAQLGLQMPADALGTQWDQNAMERNEARIELTGNYRAPGQRSNAFEDEPEEDE